jgi:Universal stress protein family
MRPIIVSTDFSTSAKQTIDYVCQFAAHEPVKIYLVHIYLMPASYSAEGVSLSTINDSITSESEMLDAELKRVKALYPHVAIETQLLEGNFFTTMQALVSSTNPEMVVMGAKSEYSEIWHLGNIWQQTLLNLDCPVWVIPKDYQFKQIQQIALSFDYSRQLQKHQIVAIQQFLNFTGATLHIVFVKTGAIGPDTMVNEALQSAFAGIAAKYHIIEDVDVIAGIAKFIKQHEIQNLIVAPHQHSLIHKLFNKSYSAQLALLNNVPVLAVRDR